MTHAKPTHPTFLTTWVLQLAHNKNDSFLLHPLSNLLEVEVCRKDILKMRKGVRMMSHVQAIYVYLKSKKSNNNNNTFGSGRPRHHRKSRRKSAEKQGGRSDNHTLSVNVLFVFICSVLSIQNYHMLALTSYNICTNRQLCLVVRKIPMDS